MDYATERAALLAGFGDPETWSPCANHPNDPRTPEVPEWELAAEAEKRGAFAANLMLGRIAQAVAHIDDPRDRLARQVGMLQSEIRRMCVADAWAELEAGQ